MEYTPIGNISDAYIQLLPCLLAPVLWERPANISPLVRLLSAFAVHAAPQIVAQDKLVSGLRFFEIFFFIHIFLNSGWLSWSVSKIDCVKDK